MNCLSTLLIATALLSSCIPLSNFSERGRPLFDANENEVEKDPTEEKERPPVRPDGLFRIKPNFCLCREGKPAMAQALDNCVRICADVTNASDQNLLLTGEVKVADPQLNITHEHFEGDLDNFCRLELHERDKNSRCFGLIRELHNNNPEFPIEGIDIGKSNRFHVRFTNELRDGRIYSLRIQAHSEFTDSETGDIVPIDGHTETIQFMVRFPIEPVEMKGRLKITTTKRYQCLTRTAENDRSFDHAFRQHFIFDEATPPSPLPDIVIYTICHNDALGFPDNELFPRLGEEKAFHLWDKFDSRFYHRSTGQQAEIEINELIKARLREKHDVTIEGQADYFKQLELPSFPGVRTQQNNAPIDNLAGFYLRGFIDPNGSSDFPICPSETDLTRPANDPEFDPIFDILGEFISGTEALYVALRTPRKFDPISKLPIDDPFFINESMAKKIWFYREGMQKKFLDFTADNFRQIISSKTIYFYWPANTEAPTIHIPHQDTYKIRSLEEIRREINPSSDNDNNARRPAPLIDRRIGCIPKSP